MNPIHLKQIELTKHPVYSTFYNVENIRKFMSYHIFAVWDFMSLLKSLQRELTCVSVPWKPSPYPAEMVRLINQIVLGEESDIGPDEKAISHFDLYLMAMEEIGADTSVIRSFLVTNDFTLIPDGAREFVKHNLDVALKGHAVEVASNFFFGREKLIPDIFQVMVDTLKKENINAPKLIYYLERHIEVDSGEHGPLALKALFHLTQDNAELQKLSETAALKALEMRNTLWDAAYRAIVHSQGPEHLQARSTQQNFSPV